jgi:hypothetical protein
MALISKLKDSDLDARLVAIFNKKMPFELLNRLVLMSDGMVGVVRAFDPNNVEYPFVEVDGRTLKTNENWYCISMYSEEEDDEP